MAVRTECVTIRDYIKCTHPVHWGLLQLRGSEGGKWFDSEGEKKNERIETQEIR